MNLALTVGAQVGMYRPGSHGAAPTIGTVTKMSASGKRATVQQDGTTLTFQFNVATGMQIGATYYNGRRLMDATMARKSIIAQTEQRNANSKVHEIEEVLRGARTGMGNYIITPERKAQLLALVEAL